MSRQPRQLKAADLENQIEKLLSKSPTTRFTALQISRKINVANPVEAIEQALMKLVSTNKVAKLGDDIYKWEVFSKDRSFRANRHSDKTILYKGTVDMTRSGAAYIINSESVEDIYVHSKNLKGALHKDLVTVSVTESRSRRRPEGQVVSIEKRALARVIGHVNYYAKYAIVTPENSKIFPEVMVSLENTMSAQDGDRVVVEITEWGKSQNKSLWGKVINILQNLTDHEMNMQSILLSNGFDPEFTPEVLEEADALIGIIQAEEILKRRDCRANTTFTIDPLTAKDFDDALSYKVLDNGNLEIGIHIADVTHFLKEGTALDKEAFRRSTSVYLVDRVCPMLPEKLSNDLCSLNPNEDKYTFGAIFEFDQKNKIISEWFGKTIIHSDRRFTYEEAQERIESGTGDFAAEINVLNGVALKLREQRYLEGSISFESEEVQFVLDENNLPIGMYTRERKAAHMLVEDFMLLANKKVATFMYKKSKPEVPFVYRIHDVPNGDKLADFALFAAELGFKFKMDKPEQIVTSFNRLAEASKENEQLKMLEPLAIRTMSKAEYSTNNIGHYGLGFEYYTHFTSPIRRYSDVLVHRTLFNNLNAAVIREDKEVLEQKAKHVSEMERKANDAERESVKYMQTVYISKFIGHVFDGIISGIIEKGIFVELTESKVEGLVTFDSIGEMYVVPASRLKAVSRISGDELKMGQKVRVRITAADPDTKRTDMDLVRDE
ncbi:MAG: ribonuclease R [Saprospiraceae bacterium]|nr:ribonuclease R [Saprospiraceae bacterium]